jgi:hypothetical protein
LKKLAIIFLFLALSMLSIAAVPVFAEPAQKVSVIAQTFNQVNAAPEKIWTTNGNILHMQGVVRTGEVWLKVGEEPAIYGTMVESTQTVVDISTGMVISQNHKTIWTFADGSFEGVKIVKQETAGPTTILEMNQHAVLKGSGIYEGYTLMLSMEAPPFPPTYTGTLLIH